MFERVVIAVNTDDVSSQAIEVGITLATALGARLGLVHVVDPSLASSIDGGLPATELLTDLHRAGKELLEEAQERATERMGAAEAMLREGDPADEILDCVRDWRADLIVLGTTGRSGLKRLLLGSTAEAV